MSNSIAQSLAALQTAKANIGTAIMAKGGAVNSGDGFSDYVADIATIPAIPEFGTGTFEVRFIDYDGTVLQINHVNSGGSVTPPTSPAHSLLTSQGWNYNSTVLSNITSDLDVGATCITTDGKSYFHITLTAVSGLAPTFYFNKSDTSELTIDYGDGTTATSSTSGNINFAHTYTAVGNYVVKAWISNGTGAYGFGNGTSSTITIGGAIAVYQQTLTKVLIGTNVTNIGFYAFASCSSLTSVTIPSGIISVGDRAFLGCYSLKAIDIPGGVTSIGAYAFQSCGSLESVSIPSSVTSIGNYTFMGCYSLKEIDIPSGVTSIGAYAFQSCYSLKQYIILPTTPPTLVSSNAFTGIVSVCHINVPFASLSAYKAATNWSANSNYMEGH